MDFEDSVMAQAVRIPGIVSVMSKGFGLRIKAVQAADQRPHPQYAAAVKMQRQDAVVAQAVKLIFCMTIMGKDPACPIKTFQTAIRANPHHAAGVFNSIPLENDYRFPEKADCAA